MTFPTERFLLEYLDGRKWKVATPLHYLTRAGEGIAVPEGFITDFASVPEVLWNILPPAGSYGKAAVVHDFLYQRNNRPRREADNIFLEAMEDLGVGRVTRTLMWLGVRLGGWKPWNGYRK